MLLREAARQQLNDLVHVNLDLVEGALLLGGGPEHVQVLRADQLSLGEHLQDVEDLERRGEERREGERKERTCRMWKI